MFSDSGRAALAGPLLRWEGGDSSQEASRLVGDSALGVRPRIGGPRLERRCRKEALNMKRDGRSRLRSRVSIVVAMALVSGASLALVVLANVPLTKIGDNDDTYTTRRRAG